jgi:hypothetical protein
MILTNLEAQIYSSMEFCQQNGIDISTYPDEHYIKGVKLFLAKSCLAYPIEKAVIVTQAQVSKIGEFKNIMRN